jgi:hypothetical protein
VYEENYFYTIHDHLLILPSGTTKSSAQTCTSAGSAKTATTGQMVRVICGAQFELSKLFGCIDNNWRK